MDRELFLNWLVIDENLSWYIDQNINMFIKNPSGVNKDDEAFKLSNRIRGVIFSIYTNNSTLERLRFHTCSATEKPVFVS